MDSNKVLQKGRQASRPKTPSFKEQIASYIIKKALIAPAAGGRAIARLRQMWYKFAMT